MELSIVDEVGELIFNCHKQCHQLAYINNHIFSKKKYDYKQLAIWMTPNEYVDISSLILAVTMAKPEKLHVWAGALQDEYLNKEYLDPSTVLAVLAGLLRSAKWLADEHEIKYDDSFRQGLDFYSTISQCIRIALENNWTHLHNHASWTPAAEAEFSKQIKDFLKARDMGSVPFRKNLLLKALCSPTDNPPCSFNNMVRDQINYAIFGSLDCKKRTKMISVACENNFDR